MIDRGASLIEGSIKKDLILASETRSLRRLVAVSRHVFCVLSLNLGIDIWLDGGMKRIKAWHSQPASANAQNDSQMRPAQSGPNGIGA
jgi:hypothetical protein